MEHPERVIKGRHDGPPRWLFVLAEQSSLLSSDCDGTRQEQSAWNKKS